MTVCSCIQGPKLIELSDKPTIYVINESTRQVLLSKLTNKTTTVTLKDLTFTGTFDSTYVALNFTLYLFQIKIFEVSVVSNKTMTIKYNDCERVIESSSMNDIKSVSLLYNSKFKMLHICVEYADQGHKLKVSTLNLSDIIVSDNNVAP